MVKRNLDWRTRVIGYLVKANSAIPDMPMEKDKVEVIDSLNKTLDVVLKQDMKLLKERMKNG